LTRNEDYATDPAGLDDHDKVTVYDKLIVVYRTHGHDCKCHFCEIFGNALCEVILGG